MRDRRSIALRSQWCVWTLRARARSPATRWATSSRAPGGNRALLLAMLWRACRALMCHYSVIYCAYCARLPCSNSDNNGHARLTSRLE
eukprot:2160341-Prymnesium_polylepis.1